MRFLICITLLTFLTFTSCKKLELDKISSSFWNPKLAAPLVYANFQVKDILVKADSSGVIQHNNGVLSVVYNTEFSSLNAASFVSLPDFNQSIDLIPASVVAIGSIPSPLNVIPQNVSYTSTDQQTIDFPTNNGAELNNVIFKGGALSVNLTTTLKHDIEATISLPDFNVNGTPLTKKLTLNYNGNIPNSTTISIPLNGAVADFTANNTGINKIRINTDSKITGTGLDVVGNENLSISVNLTGLKFKSITGYFGNLDVAGATDSVSLDLFKNVTKGVFGLTNPTVKFIVNNSFGFPAELTINDLHTKETGTGSINSMLPNPNKITLNYPTLAEKGQSKKTEIILNKTNTSNIDALVTSVPKYFYFGAGAKANPNGKTANLNFIEDTDSLKVKVEAELPMEGYAYGFELSDTIDANGSFKDIDNEINALLFRLEVTNGFPLDVTAQITFLDANHIPIKNNLGNLIKLLKSSDAVLSSGNLDNTGKVISPTVTTTNIQLTSTDIPYLKNAKYIVIAGNLETHNGKSKSSIRLYDDYAISFKLGMQIEGGVKIPSVN